MFNFYKVSAYFGTLTILKISTSIGFTHDTGTSLTDHESDNRPGHRLANDVVVPALTYEIT